MNPLEATVEAERRKAIDLWTLHFQQEAELDRKQREWRREMEAKMPPLAAYTGPTDCPKCASTAVGTRLCKRWDADCREKEHIHRDCARCGHGWLEAPLGATQETG